MRLAELDDELDDAQARHDAARHAKRSTERDALLEELARATGLGGKPDPSFRGPPRTRVRRWRYRYPSGLTNFKQPLRAVRTSCADYGLDDAEAAIGWPLLVA